MPTAYIQAAMRHARYEILPDDGSYYGEIPGFRGVLANAHTLEDCREELQSVLEDWILVRVSKNLRLPWSMGSSWRSKKVPDTSFLARSRGEN